MKRKRQTDSQQEIPDEAGSKVASNQMAQAMGAYEQRYRSLFQHLKDALYVTTLDGQFVDINPAGEMLLGYSRDEFMALNVQDLYADLTDRQRFKEKIGQSGSVTDYEVRLRRKDGEVLDCVLTAAQWQDGEGRLLGYQGIIRDVSEHRQLQQRLRERRRTLHLIISALPNLLLVVDRSGRLSAFYIPEHFPPVVDRQRIAVGARLGDVLPLDLSEAIDAARAECDVTGQAVSFEQTVTELHRPLTFQVWLSPVSDSPELLVALDDITEMKQAEAIIQAYAQELEARNQDLEAYDHTIAHDLKAPLSALQMGVELLYDEQAQLSPPGQQVLQEMDRRVRAALRMVDNLLLFARLRDLEGVLGAVDMRPVVQAALHRLQPAIEQRGVTVEVAEPLHPVRGHAPWLEEVLANLVGNAVKYIGQENRAPRIQIRSAPDAGYIRYEVEDNGVGLDPEAANRLFERFSRFHPGEAEGSGLGLSIVKRIVDRLGGEVGVRSVPEQGSVFWFTLPGPPPA